MNYVIKGSCKSVIGNVRNNNEDNYYFDGDILPENNNGQRKALKKELNNNAICSVFDGMGGEANGERASFLAASILKEYIQKNEEFSWNEYIKKANDAICAGMKSNKRMGTTMATIAFAENNIHICNVGDSRIYGMKNGMLYQLSEDHTEDKLKRRLNIQSESKAKLTQHLGIREEEMVIVPYINKYTYEEFSKFLLCSDGLTDMLNDEEIAEILAADNEVDIIADNLIANALDRGGVDNTTVIVLEVKEESRINKSHRINDFLNKVKEVLFMEI